MKSYQFILYPSSIFLGLYLLISSCTSSISIRDKITSGLPDRVDFNFHIKPILSDRCFSCHGPDENSRKAGLRLDTEEEAFARLESGDGRAFHKNRPSKSVALKRILSNDPEEMMPPPESNLSLSAYES